MHTAPEAKRKKYIGMLITACAVLSFIAGVAFRAQYIFVLHPAEQYLYSDMSSYIYKANRLFNPATEYTKYDSVYPPGGGLYYGALLHAGGFSAVYYAQFFLSVSIPLLLGAIGYALYGRRVAEIAVVLASIYPSFIMYAGFVLSENPYIAFHLLSFLLIILALRSERARWSVLCGLGAGTALGVTASFRTIALYTMVPLMMLVALYICIRRGRALRYGAIAFGVGLCSILIPLTLWCTSLMEGRLCIGSTNGAMGVLQGHYGNVGVFHWYDPEQKMNLTFASPAALQKGMHDEVYLAFGPYESSENIAEAMRYISAHPIESIGTSFRHVYDLFYGTLPWPMSHTSDRDLVTFSESWFLIVILAPACLYIVWRGVPHTRARTSRWFEDGLVIAPMLGIIAVVFITIAEPRYRIPYDPFLMLLAARAYTFGAVSGRGVLSKPLSFEEMRKSALCGILFGKNGFGRFSLIGVMNTGITIVLLNILLAFWGEATHGAVVSAYVIASAISMANSFYWNRRFVFGQPTQGRLPVVSFVVITTAGLGIGAAGVAVLYPPFLAFMSPVAAANSISLISIVFHAAWNYCWYRWYVFRPRA